MRKLTKFEQAYIECALWSSTDDLGESYDRVEKGLSSDAIEQVKKDCDSFIQKAGSLLDDIDDEQAGHDFWLTRNRHGVGFWDRGLGEIGEKLTEIAHSFGEASVYVSDNEELEIFTG